MEINVELMADNMIDYRRSSVSKSKSTLPNGVSLLVVTSTFMAACSNYAAGSGNSRCSPDVASTGAWIK
jgi:predicted small secreted protein